MQLTAESFVATLNRAIEAEIVRVVEEEAAKAAKRVEERIKETVAGIACRVVQRCNIMAYGANEITIKLDLTEKPYAKQT